jgi:hypothetical protein
MAVVQIPRLIMESTQRLRQLVRRGRGGRSRGRRGQVLHAPQQMLQDRQRVARLQAKSRPQRLFGRLQVYRPK